MSFHDIRYSNDSGKYSGNLSSEALLNDSLNRFQRSPQSFNSSPQSMDGQFSPGRSNQNTSFQQTRQPVQKFNQSQNQFNQPQKQFNQPQSQFNQSQSQFNQPQKQFNQNGASNQYSNQPQNQFNQSQNHLGNGDRRSYSGQQQVHDQFSKPQEALQDDNSVYDETDEKDHVIEIYQKKAKRDLILSIVIFVLSFCFWPAFYFLCFFRNSPSKVARVIFWAGMAVIAFEVCILLGIALVSISLLILYLIGAGTTIGILYL